MASINFKRNIKYWAVVAVLLTTDFVTGFFAFSRTMIISLEGQYFTSDEIWAVFLVIQLVWAGLFYSNGRYRVDPTISRFREIQSLLKITLTSIIVVILFNEMLPGILAVESAVFLTYWFYLVADLSIGRMIVRVIQKVLMTRGYGKKNTVIIGTDARANDIAGHLAAESAGHNLIGFVESGRKDTGKPNGPTDLPVLGSLNEIRQIIDDHHVNEVVIALEKPDHSRLLDILTRSNGAPVSLRIIPDMYEVIS